MFGKAGIEQVVEKVISKVLNRHVDELRDELVSSVLEEVKPQLGKSGEASSGGADVLLKAVAAIHAANSQRDVLRALLDSAGDYCGRAALFVVKGGSATGWQGHALPESIKDFVLETNEGAVGEVVSSHQAFVGSTGEMNQKFVSQFGAPADGQCIIAPLMLKEKVAAILYADAGTEKKGQLDSAAIQLLVLTTGTWLEVASGRKPVGTEAPVAKAAAAHAGASVSDPFAAHAPAFASSAAPAEIEESASSGPSVAGMSAEDADVHRKAQRFARLLVDEIKLYNQAKLVEGRNNKDLYDRLKEDIDKSRSTYQKRYGSTVAGPADYFTQELIRSLAEDDVSLLGSNFPR
ncbi:MAG TPA: hypothetical protein VMT53_17980 [Terriglobales bacterium]|nr:hypothetical protein [Terriglobales bacterium]